jgi:mannosyl-3-phosphoglycerate phosphatase
MRTDAPGIVLYGPGEKASRRHDNVSLPAFVVFGKELRVLMRGKKMPGIIIFTDLDGTLLHPRTYSFEEAMPALEQVRQRNIPLIFVSSKTRAEIEGYRKRLKNGHPFTSENGGGIYVPAGYFPFSAGGVMRGGYRVSVLGKPYGDIRAEFIRLRERTKAPVKGFGDMTVNEIAALTGLSREEAALAREREFDEPFVFAQKPDERFLRAIEERGLRWTRGRLYHIMGESDKGKAVRTLKTWYEREYGRMVTIGLGDGLNDLPMLRETDHPVLVRKEDGSYEEEISLPNLIKAEGVGPQGWGRAVMELLAARK